MTTAPSLDERIEGPSENERLRKKLRLATAITLVGTWELDPATGLLGADDRSRQLFGLPTDVPATLEVLASGLHPEDGQRVCAGIAATLRSGRPYMDDCRTAIEDDLGVRWVAIAADRHDEPDAPAARVLGIVHDVTDRKRSMEEHARVVDELSRAVHISELFVGILSHDLRNPLSVVLTGSHILARELKSDSAARVLKRMVSSAERMGRMIDQLLDFTRSRLGEGIPLTREPLDLAQLARDAVDDAKSASPASVLRITENGSSTGSWDRDRLCQVFSNLIGNALQHGETAGVVEVTLDGRDADRVVLTVQNQGAIPPHLLPLIFDPFRGTVERRGNPTGLGLGLYVARQIAMAHGGDLAARTVGSSTIFELSLPRERPPTGRPPHDFAGEQELAAFERMAAPPSVSAVTAQLFGATALRERAPLEVEDIATRYGQMLDAALERRAYAGQGEGLGDGLRALAERLGDLGAGPREVTEVHARALRHAVRGVTAAKTQVLLSEGRIVALELMGHLASYYRRRARAQPRPPASGPQRR